MDQNDLIDDGSLIEDEWRASFFITDKELAIDYDTGDGDPRTMALEFRNEGERDIVERVLSDPNFWVQIINALSAALKEKA